ncbi:hypothetical protein F5B21DRAFT_502550 [Xylaria acuta]|nr:hypothetical protein F5B21DRAFT_502550 [Xylaria acuta]
MSDIYLGGCRATFSVWEAEQDGHKWRRTPLADNKEFINENGEAISNCKLPLSLKDFICAKKVGKFGDFEDIPLEIPSTKLYAFYKNALARQIMDEAMEGIAKIQKKVDSALETILSVENIMEEQRTADDRNRLVMGKRELADVRTMISKVEDEVGEMKETMASVEEKMDKVGNRMEEMEEVEEDRVEVENRLAELEIKLASARAEEGRIVEADGNSRGSRVRSVFGRSFKK